MEAIRNYLETMFANMPNTPEVIKAKKELLQMMEDKYTELKETGKTENEAIGTVIAKFGNLDELAEDLGLGAYRGTDAVITGSILPFEEVKEYIRISHKKAFLRAFGIMVLIMSPAAIILFELLGMSEVLYLSLFFVLVACGVGKVVYSTQLLQKWDYLKTEPHIIDFSTTEYVHQQKSQFRSNYSLVLTVGIMCCILSFVPAVLFDELSGRYEDFGGALFLVIVAIGVFLIVSVSSKMSAYDFLLQMNNAKTCAGNFVPGQQANQPTQYNNKVVTAIMSVYWPTITSIYLCWSFLTFDWDKSWIIWPVACITHYLLGILFTTEEGGR